ncbi:hypothetical protein [Acidisoma sp. 7E03]
MPPLPDALTSYQPSPVTTAASRIVQAYLGNHRLSATEAARLAVRIETVLAALLAGGEPEETTPGAMEAEPRRAPRARSAAPRRAGRQAAPDLAAAEVVTEDEADAAEEVEAAWDDDASSADVAAPQEDAAEPEDEAEPAAEPVAEPEPDPKPEAKPKAAAAPVRPRPAPAPAEDEMEIDLLTGGPLPRAAQGGDFAQDGFVPPAPSGPRKRKRPPRPAAKRRARREGQDAGEG